jgi:hypothetical protein
LIFSLGVVFSLENSTPHCVFLFLRSSFSGDRLFPSIAYGAELERRFNAPLRPMGFLKKPFFPFWCFVHVCWFRCAYVLRPWVFFKQKPPSPPPAMEQERRKKSGYFLNAFLQ